MELYRAGAIPLCTISREKKANGERKPRKPAKQNEQNEGKGGPEEKANLADDTGDSNRSDPLYRDICHSPHERTARAGGDARDNPQHCAHSGDQSRTLRLAGTYPYRATDTAPAGGTV